MHGCTHAFTTVQHISFVESEQLKVNRLRNEMTPRIEKMIAKAFFKVRNPTGSKMRKMKCKIKLIEHVKELESRRDMKEADTCMEQARRPHAAQGGRMQQVAQEKEAETTAPPQSADKRASYRRSFLPEVIVMYEYGYDTLGHAWKEPIAAMKRPTHGP